MLCFSLLPWEGKTSLQSNPAVRYLVEDLEQKGFSRVQGRVERKSDFESEKCHTLKYQAPFHEDGTQRYSELT